MRILLKNKLKELDSINIGDIISDDVMEDGITYFGYQINKSFIESDLNQNFTYKVSITGYLSRKINTEEDTMQIVDNACEEIINKLKELNFKNSYEDVLTENNLKKIKITGYTTYNELNDKLII